MSRSLSSADLAVALRALGFLAELLEAVKVAQVGGDASS
ncbi:hypothetical protein DB30_08167 [Enhygromyxa salina]|uniref:Uncharacterized protein n=1 Tax=Enhygromyxa salina TaxID=215803 RepID=A0A0C2CUY7_9BACT|nr:hypothetical protein DB30_08167 [Enhygromyxa salina]